MHLGVGGIEKERKAVDRKSQVVDKLLAPDGDFRRGRRTVAIGIEIGDQELLGQYPTPDRYRELDAIGREIHLEMLQQLIGRMGSGGLGRAETDKE